MSRAVAQAQSALLFACLCLAVDVRGWMVGGGRAALIWRRLLPAGSLPSVPHYQRRRALWAR